MGVACACVKKKFPLKLFYSFFYVLKDSFDPTQHPVL